MTHRSTNRKNAEKEEGNATSLLQKPRARSKEIAGRTDGRIVEIEGDSRWQQEHRNVKQTQKELELDQRQELNATHSHRK